VLKWSELPKLTVRVRFPSPAPNPKAQAGDSLPNLGLARSDGDSGRRAISVQLARGHQEPGHAVLAIVTALLGLNVRVDRISYRLVRTALHMLVDHRGPLTVVPHARHQVTRSRDTWRCHNGRDWWPLLALQNRTRVRSYLHETD
jgi:hypothetical protein